MNQWEFSCGSYLPSKVGTLLRLTSYICQVLAEHEESTEKYFNESLTVGTIVVLGTTAAMNRLHFLPGAGQGLANVHSLMVRNSDKPLVLLAWH